MIVLFVTRCPVTEEESETTKRALDLNARDTALFCFLISEYEFTVSEIQFKIIDVGGDKVERRKWIEFLQVFPFYQFCICPQVFQGSLISSLHFSSFLRSIFSGSLIST
jgi:hypothetical protein